jgi:hypothetical protein
MIFLDHAICADCETLPNVFTLNVQGLFSDLDMTFEISHFRDDRRELLAWFEYWRATETPMVGFNSLGFDYPVLHYIWTTPGCSVEGIYEFAMGIINSFSKFGHQVWQDDRFCPQIDLFKIHHFDNRAKSTSLKALQFAMRSESVMEMPLPFGQALTEQEVRNVLIPYNKHDVAETKRFALFSLDAIKFRMQLSATLQGDVLNFNDSKLGSKILEQRLGRELCYEDRQPRQTIRTAIALADIIFPYIEFSNPEFSRVLAWMRTQTLTPDELSESDAIITKGVFKGVHATVGGLDFHFGTGGIHGSVEASRWAADAEWGIYDIDVAGLYPDIAVKNRLYPEHLGERFVEEYAKLPIERKEWQEKKGKKCAEANSMKLAGNGTYGNSNNQFSCFYDPKFTMAITINGQLMLCMLAEWLLAVPTLQIIQINTDGITYRARREWLEHTRILQSLWERRTRLTLESVEYSRMWIRDVNSYVAESLDGKLKQKGAYWFPRVFPNDISNAQPPAWHKDYSAQVVIKAAVEHMVTGQDIERFVYSHSDPFDFMLRAKVDRSSSLWIGDQQQQRICRYYMATSGGAMKKVSPPAKGAQVGDYKRRNGISDAEYHGVLSTLEPGAWDERIHTKNKSRYVVREMGIEAGYLVTECNVASRFNLQNVNYDWYIEQARKLVIA